MKKTTVLLTVLMLTLLLSACSNDSNYPDSVKEGRISKEYYAELSDYFVNSRLFREELEGSNLEDLSNTQMEEYETIFNRHNDYLSKIKNNPKTDDDKLVEEIIQKEAELIIMLNKLQVIYYKYQSQYVINEIQRVRLEMINNSMLIDGLVFE